MTIINKQELLEKKYIYKRSQYSLYFLTKNLQILYSCFLRSNKHSLIPNPTVIEPLKNIPYDSRGRVSFLNPAFVKIVTDFYRGFANLPIPEIPPPTPKHIWMLWQQGWDKAPKIVKSCAQSWKDKNPGWKLHLLDENTISEHYPRYKEITASRATPTIHANIARLGLLAEHGGVWADATLFCQQPLDDWLPKVMGSGFFAFSEPRPYRYYDIWFMASAPNTHLISAWNEIVVDYWQHFSRSHHYFWMEYLLEFLIAKDPMVAKIYQQTPKISALGPLATGAIPFEKPVPEIAEILLKENLFLVQKLSRHWDNQESLKDTPLGLLTGLDSLF